MKKNLKLLNIILITLLLLFVNINVLNAATAYIKVTSSTSKVVVGNTFSVSIKVSSSTSLGTWEFTPSYDKNKLKLVSGDTSVVGYGDEGVKSKTYNYKFKAIGTGNSTITVKSVGIIDYDKEKKMSTSISSKSIRVITQAELEASYSKNNNLKSLSIEGLKLSPSFKSSVTKYTANASANTQTVKVKASVAESKTKVSGTGIKKVSEGENKINVTVTAQNGSTKTYTIIVNVTDPNPIEVTINDQKYTIVKRENSLDKIDGFDKSTITINNQKVPSLYNDSAKITLVGLKNNDGDIDMYIFDKDNNTYTLFEKADLSTLRIIPLKIDDSFISKKEKDDYQKTSVIIDDISFDSLKRKNSEYNIIYAKDLTNGTDNYYLYDENINSLVRYFEEDKIIIDNDKKYKNKILEYKRMIIALGIETVAIIFVLICILIKKVKKNKKRRKIIEQKIKEQRNKKENIKDKDEIKEEKVIEEIKEEKKEKTIEEKIPEEIEVKKKEKKNKKDKKKEVQKDGKKDKKSKK